MFQMVAHVTLDADAGSIFDPAPGFAFSARSAKREFYTLVSRKQPKSLTTSAHVANARAGDFHSQACSPQSRRDVLIRRVQSRR